MKKILIILLIYLFLFLSSNFASAATVYVGTGGSNTSPYDTEAKAATTIATINAYSFGTGTHVLNLITGAVPNDATLSDASWGLGSGDNFTLQGTTTTATMLSSSQQAFDFTTSGVNWTLQNFRVHEGGSASYQGEVRNAGNLTVSSTEFDSKTTTPDAMYGLYISNFTGVLEIKNNTFKGYYETAEDANDRHLLTIRQEEGNSANHGNNQILIYGNTFEDSHADNLMFFNVKSTSGNEALIYNNIFTNFGENGIDNKCSHYTKIYNNELTSAQTVMQGVGYRPAININDCTNGTDAQDSDYVWVYQNDLRTNHGDISGTDTHLTGIAVGPSRGAEIGSYIYIYANRIEDNASGIYVYEGDYIYIYSNIIHMETNPTDTAGTDYEAAIFIGGASNNGIISNNTFYQDTDVTNWNYGINFDGATNGANWTIKNNIIYMTQTGHEALYIETDVTGDPTIDYNTYYNDNNTALVYYKGTSYTRDTDFAHAAGDWNVTGGSYPNDKGRDPYFTDKANGDLSLIEASSSEDGTGETLSATEDDGIDPRNDDFTASPPSVTLVDRDTYTPWDRGAYVFVVSTSISGMTIQ
jgi:hypothetical protein